MSDNKLSFRIQAIDDSRTGLNSSKKGIDDWNKRVEKALKTSKKMKDPFNDMASSLSKNTKELQRINKQQNSFGKGIKKTGADVSDVLKSINAEDEAIAQKMRDKGKALQEMGKQQKALQKSSGKSTTKSEKSMQDALSSGGGGGGKIQTLNVSEIKVQKFSTKEMKTQTRGGGGGGGIVGKWTSAGGKDPGGVDMNKTLSGAMGDIGKSTVIPALGLILGAVGATYGVMAARQKQYTGAAGSQMGAIQKMGSGDIGGGPGGFFSGHRRITRDHGGMYYMTGQQEAEMYGSFAGQVGGGKYNKRTERDKTQELIQNLMWGTQGNRTGTSGTHLGSLAQSYGLGFGETGQRAGMMRRFGGNNRSLFKVAGMAEATGMGGARMDEFMKSFEEILSSAVFSGSQRSNKDMLQSLGQISNSSDERIKALAPMIVQTSMQAMSQTARLKGGPAESQMYQAVLGGRMRRGESTSIEAITTQLNDNWLQTARDTLSFTKKQFGEGHLGQREFMETLGLGNITDPRTMKKIISAIESPETKGRKDIDTIIDKRLKNLSEPLEDTAKVAYLESVNALSEANEFAAEKVIKMREAVEGFVNAMGDKYIPKLKEAENKMNSNSGKIFGIF